MVALRVVKRLLRTMQRPPEEVSLPSDGALGDWYVNGRVVDGVPLLIMLSSTSLLPIVALARNIRTLPARLPGLVTRRLKRLGAPAPLIEAEVATLRPVRLARPVDRATINHLIQFNREFSDHLLPINRWDETSLPWAERILAETPWRESGTGYDRWFIYPGETAMRLLKERWGEIGPRPEALELKRRY